MNYFPTPWELVSHLSTYKSPRIFNIIRLPWLNTQLTQEHSYTNKKEKQEQYSTVQYSTVQYSTVQYSTVQYSTVQYSTVQYSKTLKP